VRAFRSPFFSSNLWPDCTICRVGAMGPNGVPKFKLPSMMVDEMVDYQYASKSHIILAVMFFITTSYRFCLVAHEHPKPWSSSLHIAQVFA